ncbi:MAG TPA: HD domain-containing protein [Thermoplasmatales archaeon]|nr:HD domain-containing protein [Thermoplasmatales archaeon]
MENLKYIRDSLYGNIKIEGVFLDLIETPELQRLNGIKQLGFTYLVYPGANHTRLEHSLGVCHVARKICEVLEINEEEVAIASLLHDVGHCPFSHTLEYLLHVRTGKDHVELTKEIIKGEAKFEDIEQDTTINEILNKYGIDTEEIINILSGKKNYLSEIISGPLDADQIDYLMRDAYYTGVAYGVIDSERIIHTMRIYDESIVFEKKSVSALESMLLARALMYSSVYLHKTVRIAELMLIKAVEKSPPFNFSQMTDCELMEKLKLMGKYQRDIVCRLKYRRLFKKALAKRMEEMNEEEKEVIANIKNLEEIENEIAEKVGLEEGYIIVDIPGKDIILSEPRIRKVDIKILDNGKIKPLSYFTPLASALQMRGITEWTIMVCCPEKYREKVAREAEKILFG